MPPTTATATHSHAFYGVRCSFWSSMRSLLSCGGFWQDIVVFVVGGTTYEESRAVWQLNAVAKKAGACPGHGAQPHRGALSAVQRRTMTLAATLVAWQATIRASFWAALR